VFDAMQRGRCALDVFCTRAADLLWLDVVYVFGDSALGSGVPVWQRWLATAGRAWCRTIPL
jgi:hypothetical protein